MPSRGKEPLLEVAEYQMERAQTVNSRAGTTSSESRVAQFIVSPPP